jgi:CheY-like chemotaxis protein
MPSVVVIDDEPGVRAVAAHFLKGAGYSVATAADGREGAMLLRRGDVHLVITDLVMPEVEGIETIIQVRREFPHLRIVAMSGTGLSSEYFRMARLLGAHATLAKPFSAEELLAVVNSVLGGR